MSDAQGVEPTQGNFIATDLYCVSCGYNLRTLWQEGICPECGSPVCKSTLTNAESVWLRQVRRGLTWLLSTTIFFASIGLGLFILRLAYIGLHLAQYPGLKQVLFNMPHWPTSNKLTLCISLAGTVWGCVAVFGVYLITLNSTCRSHKTLPGLGFATRTVAVLAVLGATMRLVFMANLIHYWSWIPYSTAGVYAAVAFLNTVSDSLIVIYLHCFLASRGISIQRWFRLSLCCILAHIVVDICSWVQLYSMGLWIVSLTPMRILATVLYFCQLSVMCYFFYLCYKALGYRIASRGL